MSKKPHTEIYYTSSLCRENCYLRLSDLKVLDLSKKRHQSLWELSTQVHVYSILDLGRIIICIASCKGLKLHGHIFT